MSSRKRKARDDEPGSRSEDEERDVIAGVEHAEGDSDDDQRDEREGCSGESDDSDVEDERFFIACSVSSL